jgi:FAD/FMN-containing dehydrogenase
VHAKLTNVTTEAARPPSFFRKFNEIVLENGALWLFSAFNRQFPRFNESICNLMTQFIADVTDVSSANQVFASVRLVKFQEMEYNIPAEHFTDAIREIDAAIRKHQIKVHFPVECRFVKSDDIYLSPAYGRDSAYIAVHMFKGMEYRPYFALVEDIMRGYGGRPHWGKMHTRTAADLAPFYPRWEAFHAVRRRLDPQGVFLTPYLKSILGD